jgi:hypothetical protein
MQEEGAVLVTEPVVIATEEQRPDVVVVADEADIAVVAVEGPDALIAVVEDEATVVIEQPPELVVVSMGEQGIPGPRGDPGAPGAASPVFYKRNEGATTIPVGTAVYAATNAGVLPAQAHVEATSKVIGIATLDIAAGASDAFKGEGVVSATAAEWEIATGQVGGLAINQTYFLSADTPGRITNTPPSNSGEYVCPIGRAISSTELYVDIENRIKM